MVNKIRRPVPDISARRKMKEWEEKMQALVEDRSRARVCGDCKVCEQDPVCGWKQGLLLDGHRPDLWGMVLQGKQITPEVACFVFSEVYEDVRTAETVVSVLSPMAHNMAFAVADHTGRIVNVMGPAEAADRIMAALAPAAIRCSDETLEVVMEAQPDNPLDEMVNI